MRAPSRRRCGVRPPSRLCSSPRAAGCCSVSAPGMWMPGGWARWSRRTCSGYGSWRPRCRPRPTRCRCPAAPRCGCRNRTPCRAASWTRSRTRCRAPPQHDMSRVGRRMRPTSRSAFPGCEAGRPRSPPVWTREYGFRSALSCRDRLDTTSTLMRTRSTRHGRRIRCALWSSCTASPNRRWSWMPSRCGRVPRGTVSARAPGSTRC